MEYLVVFENGKSLSFYNETVAKMYKTINGGYIINLKNTEPKEVTNEIQEQTTS